MSDRLDDFEVQFIRGGLRILGLLTFVAFLIWALWHLTKMFH